MNLRTRYTRKSDLSRMLEKLIRFQERHQTAGKRWITGRVLSVQEDIKIEAIRVAYVTPFLRKDVVLINWVYIDHLIQSTVKILPEEELVVWKLQVENMISVEADSSLIWGLSHKNTKLGICHPANK